MIMFKLSQPMFFSNDLAHNICSNPENSKSASHNTSENTNWTFWKGGLHSSTTELRKKSVYEVKDSTKNFTSITLARKQSTLSIRTLKRLHFRIGIIGSKV